MTRNIAWMTSLVGLAFALASCGGGSPSSGEAQTTQQRTTSSTPDPTTTEPELSEGEAVELAESMLLRLRDFPTGWRAQASDDDDRCVGIDEVSDRFNVLAHERSQDFAQGELTTVTSSAGLLSDEQSAREALNYLEGAIQSDEFQECVADGAREEAEAGVEVGEIEVGQVSFPALGERSSAWEVVIPFTADGVSVTAYVDGVYVLHDNAVAVLAFTDVFAPFDEAERERLARLLAERMEDALSGG